MGYRSQYHFFNSLFGHDAQTHDICPLGLGGNSSSGPKPVYETSSSFTDTAILVACRSEFVTADAAGGVGVFPLDRPSMGRVGIDVAAEFASQVGN